MIAAEPEKLSAATTSAARSPGVPAMTTTGTRAASRSMMLEATKPSPMRIPSTLPDRASIREKSGRSPCMKVISSDQLFRCRIHASTPRSTSS